jgi:hypothetical protein
MMIPEFHRGDVLAIRIEVFQHLLWRCYACYKQNMLVRLNVRQRAFTIVEESM